MTVPVAYETASADFRAFLVDARDEAGLTTTNQAWGTLLAVFHVFRRRLTVAQAITFAKALPPSLCAVFVADLHPGTTPIPFAGREALTEEVLAFHRDHNFSPESAIENIATALRRHVDVAAFDRALGELPRSAYAFWQGRGTGQEEEASLEREPR